MHNLILYSKPDCSLCDDARQMVQALLTRQDSAGWTLAEVNILDNKDLFAAYNLVIPVLAVEGGPTLIAPYSLDAGRVRGVLAGDPAAAPPVAGYRPSQPTPRLISALNNFGNWLNSGWLVLVSVIMAFFAGLPWLAPMFAGFGLKGVADPIYLLYMFFCHQLPERAGMVMGYQAAYCWRNTAIYTTMLGVGLLFGLAWRQSAGDTAKAGPLAWLLRPMSLPVFLLLLLPIAVDGFTHLLGMRATNAWFDTLTGGAFPGFASGDAVGTLNWWLRIVSGTLFGYAVVRLVYPWVARALAESHRQTLNYQSAVRG